METTSEKNNGSSEKSGLKKWRKKNRFNLQVGALAAALVSPFGIYMGLASGNNWLTEFFFVILALSMLVTAWAG